ncbi:TWiK family of potassium channels protein 18 [Papilio xuthus]|uniref:TWiK family of potassium channels protein 18 n=1 Tax=Papilio xuthus TaxID=66420 RepID=A0A194QNY7_PAPXU|nr:TWiK family of potassium channels protein 18 [Papilio xuthus]
MATSETLRPPLPKRLRNPELSIKMPQTNPSIIYRNAKFVPHISHNEFMQIYQNKASEFMFKQFEDLKDFTMDTAKTSLSVGEKFAFWFYNKLKWLSKKWFTHLLLLVCLSAFSIVGGIIFTALEASSEQKYDKRLSQIRRDAAITIIGITNNKTAFEDTIASIVIYLKDYENNYSDCMKHLNDNDTVKNTWTFWNSVFYAGTIFTTIGEFFESSLHQVMNENDNPLDSTKISTTKASSQTQTPGKLVSKSPDRKQQGILNMEDDTDRESMSLRKRRNLSKNRGQAMRQREKTPEPSRTQIPHEDTPTSDDEDNNPRNTREIEADKTYEEMRRLVQEKANLKDPVYDLDRDEVLEARAMAANERRRRSISPFAVPDKEESSSLERKGSFIDPTNKLLTTNYTLGPKDDESTKHSSMDATRKENRGSLSPPTTASSSPREKNFPYPMPIAPKKLEELVYPDEVNEMKTQEKSTKSKVSPKKDEIKIEDDKITQPQKTKPPKPETVPSSGELITRVMQVERTPSKKLTQDQKPVVEIRERVVRTPSRKLSAEQKPSVVKQIPSKPTREEPKSKIPPVKPARSKSASRFGSKTSESEMSEDQLYQEKYSDNITKRKVTPTPRRFIKSPRANRSQSFYRTQDSTGKTIDKTGTGISQTSLEIIELMQKARARSLSIPKDDPRLPTEYKKYNDRVLKTPNKTPTNLRHSRGISCPKTIQIISDKEILSGITSVKKPDSIQGSRSRHSSGYIDASQSEYTSSCYSSSPSENEYEFDLSERTAELTRKLNLLSEEVDKKDSTGSISLTHTGNILQNNNENVREQKSILRKRNTNNLSEEPIILFKHEPNIEEKLTIPKKITRSRWKHLARWQQFQEEQKDACMMFKMLEGSFENAFKCGSRSVKRDFIESLWRGSHYLREEDWKSMARNKLFEFENQLHTAHEAGVTSYSGQRSWNFMNSFVYCLTLITTIGYGHIAPKTTYGRVATIEVIKGLNIVYDVVRRPSQIFSEEDIDELPEDNKPPPVERKDSDVPPPLPPKPGTLRPDLENATDPDTPAPSVFEIDDEFNLPISVAITILAIYIIIGALAFNIWEKWDFFESFYFVFISMSTIGLGDLVPDHPMFMMASILYLIFGLALTSMCINVVQVKLSDTFKQASAKLGATIGLKVAEEDGSLVPITPPPVEIAPIHKPKIGTTITEAKINDTSDIDSKNR